MEKEQKERIVYLDILRIVACIFVIGVHVSANQINDTDTRSFDWQVMNLLNAVSITAPAVFIMLSGAIFLDPDFEIPMKKLYGRHILRMAAAYAFWCCLYTLIPIVRYYDFSLETVKTFFLSVLTGTPMYHMWYVPMMIALYIIVPLLRPMAEKKNLCRYYLLLYMIVQLIIPTILKFSVPYKRIFESLYGKIPYILITGYTGYFILGRYLSKEELDRRKRYALYIAGLLAIAVSVGIDGVLAFRYKIPVLTMNDIFTINHFLFAAGVFVAFRYFPWKIRHKRIVAGLSKLTFGIYLIHVLVMEGLFDLCPFLYSLPAIVWIPLVTLATFCVSAFLIWPISRIPVLGKYIV